MIQNFNSNLMASGTVTAPTGTFSESLTISGVAVATEGGGGSALTVQAQDEDPLVSDVSTIKFTNGTVTDEGSGVVSVETGGSGGSGGSDSPRFLHPERIYNARIRPKVPDTVNGIIHDDEFHGEEGDLIDTNLWSVLDPGDLSDNPPEITFDDSVKIQTSNGASTTGDLVGIYQEAPPASVDYTVFSYVGLTGHSAATTEQYCGIMFLEDVGDPENNRVIICGILMHGHTAAAPAFQVGIWEWSTPSTSSDPANIVPATPAHFDDAGMEGGVWIRAIHHRDSGLDRLDIAWSRDGVAGWNTVGNASLGIDVDTAAPDGFGLGYKRYDGFSPAMTAACFRVINGDSAFEVVPADYMYVETDSTASGTVIPGISEFKGALVSLINGNTEVLNNEKVDLQWQVAANDADYDTDGFLSTSGSSYFEIPSTGVARVKLSSQIMWDTDVAGARSGEILANGAESFAGSPSHVVDANTYTTNILQSPVVTVTGGQRFVTSAENGREGAGGAGSAVDVLTGNQTWFAIEVIG